MKHIFISVLLLLCWMPARAVEAPPSRAAHTTLLQAQALMDVDNISAAQTLLEEWKHQAHSLHQLLLGRCYHHGAALRQAIAAFKYALVLDPASRDAAMLLAEVYYRSEDWQPLCILLAQWVDVQTADEELMQIYCISAYEAQDYRLAAHLVRAAMIRFPQQQIYRTLDIQLLLASESWHAASSALRHALDVAPAHTAAETATLWQQLAYVAQHNNDNEAYAAALEAAYILDPHNASAQRAHAHAQWSLGHTHEALTQFTKLCAAPDASDDTLQIASTIAHAAGNNAQAARWLQRIPEQRRSQSLRLQALRLHLQMGQNTQADNALDTLIAHASATADHDTLLWAGQLAEKNKRYAQAETLYQLCCITAPPTSAQSPAPEQRAQHMQKAQQKAQKKAQQKRWRQTAQLSLVRLYYQQQRHVEAHRLLSAHRQEFPDDRYAHKLSELIEE